MTGFVKTEDIFAVAFVPYSLAIGLCMIKDIIFTAAMFEIRQDFCFPIVTAVNRGENLIGVKEERLPEICITLRHRLLLYLVYYKIMSS